MGSEDSQTLSISLTEGDRSTHPVKIFLHECGIDVADFPRLRFVLESDFKFFRSHRICVPLRLPKYAGMIFESFLRITRVLEIPDAQGERHRQFMELEWSFDEIAYPEEEYHTAFSFLSRELECPNCRENFPAKPRVLDVSHVQIECTQCHHLWNIHFQSPTLDSRPCLLLLDSFRNDPKHTREQIRNWVERPIEADDKNYYQYFPYHLTMWESGSSLNWLFGESVGYTSLKTQGDHDFESLARAFVNTLTTAYFKTHHVSTQSLERTEIQRKQEAPARKFGQEVTRTVVTKTVTKKNPWRSLAQVAAAVVGIGALVISGTLVKNVWMPVEAKIETPKQFVAFEAPQVDEPIELPKISDAQQIDAPKVSETNEIVELPPLKETISKEPATPKKLSPPAISLNLLKPRKAKSKKKLEITEKFRQAMLHLKLEQFEEASNEFQSIINLDPNNTGSYRGLGLAYVYEQRFAEAISAFEQYLKLSKNKAPDQLDVEEILTTLRERVTPTSSVAKQ